MEYSVYFAGSELPTRAAWEAQMSAAGFPISFGDDFSHDPQEGYVSAKYGDWWFDFGYLVDDADVSRPVEASSALRVAVFQPVGEVGEADEVAYTAMLAATFAEITEGLMRNDETGELFRGAEALEYARWLLTVPETEE